MWPKQEVFFPALFLVLVDAFKPWRHALVRNTGNYLDANCFARLTQTFRSLTNDEKRNNCDCWSQQAMTSPLSPCELPTYEHDVGRHGCHCLTRSLFSPRKFNINFDGSAVTENTWPQNVANNKRAPVLKNILGSTSGCLCRLQPTKKSSTETRLF